MIQKIKKIMFLNPPFSAEQLYGDLSGAGSELPPLGIALLAAITRKIGFEISILDAAALKLSYEQTVKKIITESPDVLGITSTIISIYNAADIAKMVKSIDNRIKIIIGGAHITSSPYETMSIFSGFDVGVVGEGEVTLLKLIECLENDVDLANCKGIIFRNDGKLISTVRMEMVKDLDSLPMPAWDLLPDLVRYYQPAADSLNRSPATLLITSRGCTGQCVFCEKSMFGDQYRGFSAEYIVKMIEYLQENYGIKDIFFEDDNFLIFRKRTKEFCRLIKERKIDISFSIMGRVDMVTPEILELLKEAGCWQINYGCESGSQRILENINKGIRVEQIERALNMTHKAGLKIKGLFMLGNFGETRETIDETFRFIKKIPMDDFHITFFTPLPGTVAYKIADRYGRFDPDWRKARMTSAPDNFIPNGFTYEELISYHRKAYRIFYLRPRIIFYYFIKMFKSRKFFLKIVRAGISFAKYTIVKHSLWHVFLKNSNVKNNNEQCRC